MIFAALALAVVGFVCLIARHNRWRGSTLIAAWWWNIASWSAIVAAQIASTSIGGSDSLRLAALRWIAAVGASCPLMALLGAKRPQNRPWQFIVLSLWVVLALPAAQTLFVRPDRPLSPHAAVALFLAALAAAGAWNGFGTRYFLAALALACGQGLLLAEFFFVFANSGAIGLAGMALLIAGWGVALLADQKAYVGVAPLDKTWLEFRDAFGGFWASRVVDRMNVTGRLQEWNVELTWNGFQAIEESAEIDLADEEERVTQAFVNLLRRFVSAEWIAARLGQDLE